MRNLVDATEATQYFIKMHHFPSNRNLSFLDSIASSYFTFSQALSHFFKPLPYREIAYWSGQYSSTALLAQSLPPCCQH